MQTKRVYIYVRRLSGGEQNVGRELGAGAEIVPWSSESGDEMRRGD